jgi:kinesin family protein 6/9
VENLKQFECNSAKEAIQLYNIGIKNKLVTSHKMNHASSRSHCIFSIQVDYFEESNPTTPAISSKMFLVDLAGSERIPFIGDIDKQT